MFVSGRGRPSTSSNIDSRYDWIYHFVNDLDNEPRTGKKKQLHCCVSKNVAGIQQDKDRGSYLEAYIDDPDS